MTHSFKKFRLSLAALCLAAPLVHAQTAEAPARDTIVVNKGGYSSLEKTPTAAEVDFANKSKVVRDAFRKREVRKQQDQRNLPAPSVVVDSPSKGPLR